MKRKMSESVIQQIVKEYFEWIVFVKFCKLKKSDILVSRLFDELLDRVTHSRRPASDEMEPHSRRGAAYE